MSKQYKGWEIAKMIYEGTLKEGTQLIDNEEGKFKIQSGTLVDNEVITKRVADKEVSASYLTDKTVVYKIIQEPVSFIEAIANDKNRIKVDLNNNHFCMSDVRAVNNYMSIREMFGELKNRFSDYGISKAIKEGKWYIEESEDDSNE